MAQRVSLEEYAYQCGAYTDVAVAQLMVSDAYQAHMTTCFICGCIWSRGDYTEDCLACGGAAMQRPCCICDGVCGAIWHRQAELSRSHGEAHWDGKCLLPAEEQERLMLARFITNQDELAEAFAGAAVVTAEEEEEEEEEEEGEGKGGKWPNYSTEISR